MARVDLQCACGHQFFVGDAQLTPQRTATCPACDAVVRAPGAAKAGAPRTAPRPVAPVAAAPDPFSPAPPADSRKKLYIIVGASAAALVVLGIVLAIVLSKPSVDYEKEAEKAVQARKKAFEEISSKPSSPTGTPAVKPSTPEKAAPVAASRPVVPESRVKPLPSPPPTVAPAEPAFRPGVALSPDVVARLRTELLPLHPFYLSLVLTPGDKTHLDGIVATGLGLPGDADFVQGILNGTALKAVRDEVAQISQTIPTLDRESQEGLPIDKVTLADGRVLNCRILDESPEIVKVSRTMSGGVGGQLPLRRENITRLEKGKGVGTEFQSRWETAQKGTMAGLVELLVWCKENALTGQGKLVAYTILKTDPSNTQARAEAGLPADPVKNSEEVARGGVIVYQGRNWPARELKEKFLKDGYALFDGQWYSKKEKMISVPGLFRYERQNDKPVLFGGSGMICHDTEITYKTVQDLNSNSFTETPEIKNIRRFYAPPMTVIQTSRIPGGVVIPPSTSDLDIQLHIDEGMPAAGVPMKGEVTMSIPLGEPLLEASIITTAEVKAGGSITIYHVTGSGDNEKRTKLYMCEAREGSSHAIPVELIRGSLDLNLLAVIEEPATYIQKVERRHARAAIMKGKYQVAPAVDVIHYRQIPDYKAELFPSTSNTIEVFRLRAILADPAPQLTKLFAANPDVLR
jgi:hypothetical protein